MYNPIIGIIIITKNKEKELLEFVNNIINKWNESFKVYILDQTQTNSVETSMFYSITASAYHSIEEQRIRVIKVESQLTWTQIKEMGLLFANKDNLKYGLIFNTSKVEEFHIFKKDK